MGLKLLFPASAGAGFPESYAQDRSRSGEAGPVDQHDVEDPGFHPQGWCTGRSFYAQIASDCTQATDV